MAGLSPASISDLGATVAKDWRPMYRFILAGLSSAIISDLDPTVAKNWPTSVTIIVDRSMYRSLWAGQSSASISYLGQPNHGPK